MREIKFRAWDEELERMFYSTTEQFDDSLSFRFKHFETDDPVYMQYTGLRDKNGKEIYEGDIVEQELLGNVPLDFGSFIGVVKFIDGTYMIENAEGTFGVELFSETNPNEVIGNIYENPELLEESK